jgi:hypothetical protein
MTEFKKLENTVARLFYMLFVHCELEEREKLAVASHGKSKKGRNSTPFVGKRDGQFSLTRALDMQDGTKPVFSVLFRKHET